MSNLGLEELQSILERNSQLREERKFDQAIDLVKESLELFISDTNSEFELLYALIETYFYNNQLTEACATGEKLLSLSKNILSIEKLIKAILLVGEVYHIAGNLEKAEILYGRAYELAKEGTVEIPIDLKEESIYALANLNQHYIGNYKRSYQLYEEALAYVKKYKLEKQSFYIDHLAMASLTMDQYDKALELQKEAEKFISNKLDINYLYHQIQKALVYFKMKNFNQVIIELIKFLEPNKQSIEKFNDVYDFGWIYLILANTLASIPTFDDLNLEKIEQILHVNTQDPDYYFKKSLEYAEKSPYSKSLQITCKIDYVKFLFSKNTNMEQATRLLEEALDVASNRQYRPLVHEALAVKKQFIVN